MSRRVPLRRPDTEPLAKLALCRMPATAEDLEKISAAFGMEPGRLGELLQVDLWE